MGGLEALASLAFSGHPKISDTISKVFADDVVRQIRQLTSTYYIINNVGTYQ